MAKSEKLFEVLELIKKSPNMTPKELAEFCDVSERAIYRYINTLSKVGILVNYRKGSYKIQGYYGDILNNFKPESLEAIKKLLIAGMRLHTDEEILQHGQEFLKLIDMNLPKEENPEPDEIDIIPETVRAINHGGIVTIGHGSKPDIINPILTNDTISVNLLDLIFSSLIKFDEFQRPIPDAARSWEISDDGLTWTFFLREDITFHDGKPLTSNDVEFTYKSIVDPKNKSLRAQRYDIVKDFQTDGDYIFKVILKQPLVAFLPRLSRAIAPKHLMENIDVSNNPYNRKPIGSGPFKLADWTENDVIVLEANSNYFRKDRPILDKLIFKFYDNREDALEAMTKGRIDIAFNSAASDLLVMKESGAFRIYPTPIHAVHALIFNLDYPVFKDIKVRKAFDYAIDKETMADNLLKNHGAICTGPFAMDSWAYNHNVMSIPYNIEKAKDLLKQAGWQDNDGDGILDKNGQKFEMLIRILNTSDILERMANAISSYLMQVGIKVDVVFSSSNDLKAQNMPFYAILTTIVSGEDPEYVRNVWHSKDRSGKLTDYKNQFVDDLVDMGRLETDIEKRKDIYYKVHELIHDDCPAIFLTSAFEYISTSYKFRWNRPRSMMSFLTSMKDWQIIDKSKEKAINTESEKIKISL